MISFISPLWLSIEETRLRLAVNRFGTRNWNLISRQVITRGPIECRNRWNRIVYNVARNRSNNRFTIYNFRRNMFLNRPRITQTPEVIDHHDHRQFRDAIQNAASNDQINAESTRRNIDRDVRMTLDYILNNTS